MARVALIKGNNRRENTRKSLELIGEDIQKSLTSRQPVIKPNFVSSTIQLASSHVDHIRGILDFFSTIYQGKIIIAEASSHDTQDAYENFGFMRLQDEYNVELLDLNKETCKVYPITATADRVIPVRLSCMLLDRNNYIISAAKMKTHDSVVVTLSIKNMAAGCIRREDKIGIHQGVRQINHIIAELAALVRPDLVTIDGFVGMEGDGPSRGDPVPLGVSIASIDALAADIVACTIMGVDPDDVGYLQYCAERHLGEADMNRIDVLGSSISDCIRPFKLHRSVKEQLAWKRESRLSGKGTKTQK